MKTQQDCYKALAEGKTLGSDHYKTKVFFDEKGRQWERTYDGKHSGISYHCFAVPEKWHIVEPPKMEGDALWALKQLKKNKKVYMHGYKDWHAEMIDDVICSFDNNKLQWVNSTLYNILGKDIYYIKE